MIIHSSAPCRVSFAGGGTDCEPFVTRYGGCVVSAAIKPRQRVELRPLDSPEIIIRSNVHPEPIQYAHAGKMSVTHRLGFVSAIARELHNPDRGGFEINLTANVPAQSGLGGSGAMAVAVVAAFNHLKAVPYDRAGIAELAYRLETDAVGNPTGRQDHVAAAHGGWNYIEFGSAGTHVSPLWDRREAHKADAIADGLLLFWLGQRDTDSGRIIKEQSENINGSGSPLDAMMKTKELVPKMREAIVSGDIERIGTLLEKLWQLKRTFHEGISSTRIDRLHDEILQAGAFGFKLCGAGGGGHSLVVCPPELRTAVITHGEAMGMKHVPLTFANEGLKVWTAPNDPADTTIS